MDLDKSDTLFAKERKIKILELINKNKKATVAQLQEYFKVSSVTIRNDLRELERSCLLIRTHGGAMVKSKTAFEIDPKRREVQRQGEKRRIAKAALAYIENGDTIILDSGSTILELARLLGELQSVIVVTNDIQIARTLEEFETVSVLVMGGFIRKNFHCTVGMMGIEMISSLGVDKAFMGTNSFSLEKGATTPDINHAETKKAMISISNQVYLLCDKTKIGGSSFAQFAPPDKIDCLITDDLDQKQKEEIEAGGIEVVVV